MGADRLDRLEGDRCDRRRRRDRRRRPRRQRAFWRGVAEALALPLVFAAWGLAWSQLLAPAPAAVPVGAGDGAAPPAYPASPVAPPDDDPRLWLVDGFNVVHAGMLGAEGRRADWWRAETRDALLARAEGFDDPDAEIWVVFDGPHVSDAEPPDGSGRVRGAFASCADDWLVERVREAEEPARVAVVTADRRVAGRARHRGARVVAPLEFLRRCPGGSDSASG